MSLVERLSNENPEEIPPTQVHRVAQLIGMYVAEKPTQKENGMERTEQIEIDGQSVTLSLLVYENESQKLKWYEWILGKRDRRPKPIAAVSVEKLIAEDNLIAVTDRKTRLLIDNNTIIVENLKVSYNKESKSTKYYDFEIRNGAREDLTDVLDLMLRAPGFEK